MRTTFTDWAEVRAQAKGSSLDAGSSPAQVSAFLNRAFDLDLTSGSGLSESTYLLMRRFGVSPPGAQWGGVGPAGTGQVDVLRVDDDVDMPGIERALRRLGYTAPPGGSGSGGTWVGGADLVAGLGQGATPVQQNVVVLPDHKLVLMSDSATYAGVAASV